MRIIITLLLSLCCITTFGQDKTKLIEQIHKKIKAINSDNTLKKKTLDNKGFSEHPADGGMQLTGFYKEGAIKKIISWHGVSSGNQIFEYYFEHDILIFVYEHFHSFVYDKKKENFQLDTTEITFEGQYYFANNLLIDYTTTGHNRFEDDNIDPGETLSVEAEENKKLLARKIK